MTTNIMKKAAGASNTNGPHTDTNDVNFLTDGAMNQAPESMAIAAPSIPPSPHKATILEALGALFDRAGVFSAHSLTTRKRNKTAVGGAA